MSEAGRGQLDEALPGPGHGSGVLRGRKGSCFTKEIEVADTSIIVGRSPTCPMITPLDSPHRMVTTSGAPRRLWPADYQP
ncbi:hypothetical protein [Streptomyces olivochromogenes]|uniref:hypothetical protein n=1 Tax=Streptomyces olivochromogenes TaxID=1963 RepID=UPI000B32ECCF|nr:hypothetical protein [Streptomyces olivochromogenes]